MRKFDPWLGGMLVAIVAVVGSLIFLASVLANRGDGDAAAEPDNGATPGQQTPGQTPGGNGDDDNGDTRQLTYEGNAPERFLANLSPVAPGDDPDIRFGAADGEPLRAAYWTPVAALWTGVDMLTTAELQGLLDGSIADWSQVGGQPGPVQYFEVTGSAGASLAAEVAPGAVAAQQFASVDELLAAMTGDSGAIAFIPLDDLTTDVTALGVDGADIARGLGEVSAWPFVETVTVQAASDDGEDLLAQLRTMEPAPPAVTRLVVTGDYLPVRCSLAAIEATGDWTSMFQTTLGDYLREADLLFSSQDGSVQDLYEPLRCQETVNLTSPPGAIDGLLAIGVDAMTVATNHIFDCGTGGACGDAAFLRTLELLHEAGIKTSGGGRNLEEALAPATFEINGLTIGLLSYDDIAAGNPSWLAATEDSPGTAPMDDDYDDEYAWNPGAAAFYAPAELLGVERMTAQVAAVAEEVDFLVVMFNSGTEDTHIPSERSVKALRAAQEAGADLVIGNQAHHVQAAESRDGVFIAYALGNFIYDQVHTPEHTQGYLLEASIWEDRVAAVRQVPYQIEEYYRPEMAEGALRTKILGDVWGYSHYLQD